MGEPLRLPRDPSVSELLARRCKQIAVSGKEVRFHGSELLQASELATRFTWWDKLGSLRTIKELMAACIEKSLDPEQSSQSGIYARYIAAFTIVHAAERPQAN